MKLTIQPKEHPWVTSGGTDPLLPASENCAELISPPTDSEMNAAITGNVGRVIAVVSLSSRPGYSHDSSFFPDESCSSLQEARRKKETRACQFNTFVNVETSFTLQISNKQTSGEATGNPAERFAGREESF